MHRVRTERDAYLGLLGAALAGAYALAGLPLSKLADRLSRNTIIGLSLTGWSLATGLTGLTCSFAAFIGLRLVGGVRSRAPAPRRPLRLMV